MKALRQSADEIDRLRSALKDSQDICARLSLDRQEARAEIEQAKQSAKFFEDQYQHKREVIHGLENERDSLIAEIQAARKVVDAVQCYVRCPEDERTAIEEGIIGCLEDYDFVIKGQGG